MKEKLVTIHLDLVVHTLLLAFQMALRAALPMKIWRAVVGGTAFNPTAPARCKAVGQPFQADAVYLVCAKPGGLGQPGKADVHTLRCRINGPRLSYLIA